MKKLQVMRKMIGSVSVVLVLTCIIWASVSATAAGQEESQKRASNAPTPTGYKEYLTFMSTGNYKSPDGTILLDGLAGDGMAFQKTIMGRTDAEIAMIRQQAIDFIAQQFGLDAIHDPDLRFSGYQVDPRNELRAYTISGEHVSSKGWPVFDGGFQAIVMNPNGVTLGGHFPGAHVPMNTVFVFGDYKIIPQAPEEDNHADSENSHLKPIVIHYQSAKPMIFAPFGALVRCELSSDEFGEGLAGGVNGSVVQKDGLLHSNIREVLTFPPLGPNSLP